MVKVNTLFLRKLLFMKWITLCLATGLSGFSLVQAQTFSACNFDATNGTAGNVVVTREVSASFSLVPQNIPATVTFGANASSSASGLNEVEIIAGDITNNTGGDISELLIPIKGVAFWTQSISNTQFRFYTWNAAQQRFEGTLGDGRSVYVTVLGARANGVDLPASQIQLMPYSSVAAGYTFSTTASAHPVVSFTDGGTATVYTTPAASQAMPVQWLTLKLGSLANGAKFTGVSVKLGLQIAGGGDTWVNYSGDSGPGDYDYYFYLDATFMGIPYDYGDAPASYGVAQHAYAICANPLYLGGARPDYEVSTSGSAGVNADNNNTAGYNDEDVTAGDYNGTSVYTLAVPYTNSTGSTAFLSGWIDWNNNGSFDASEGATASVPAGSSSANLVWRSAGASAGEGAIPAGVTTGYKIVRLRIAKVAAEIAGATGTAGSGEVEDLRILVTAVLPVTFGSVDAYIQHNQIFVNWQSLQEVNNDHYNVEVSTDGKHFQSIGTVAAEHGGNSSNVVNYHFNTGINSALALGAGLLSFGLLALPGRRRRWMIMISLLTLGSMLIAACNKDRETPVKAGDKIWVRIAQIDKDGGSSYSKVVQAIRK